MTIVIAAGGTGGHLYPAVALAREFLRCDPRTQIVFVGTPRGIESKVLVHEGFKLVFLTAKPFMGTGWWRKLQGLLSVPVGFGQSLSLLHRCRADLVIGVGGYTSPTMLAAAALTGIARVILEPNAHPGLANKAVAPLVQRIFLAFESAGRSFDRQKVRVVGTPIRREFLVHVQERHRDATNGRRLLIFGGSQGARAINSAVIEELPSLMRHLPDLAITHQTGEADHQRVSDAYRQTGVHADVVPFLYDMPRALLAADLVVARAGAMTIAELTACGKPAILVPLPTAIYDHQMKNARAMEEAGGALVLPQAELTGTRLGEAIVTLFQNGRQLQAMRESSWRMRRIDAAEVIARECYNLMGVTYDTNGTVGGAGSS
ncbi:MAG: undecaprenyldiphospho-muramoylpentapeptide beta-N-acetylglucosaminyltransferase [Nitrospiraceae bacterium]|nr:undecaprenyldiphospho-muramoylpentapeptide beta-N-acetylglucosaminyltransferase [Nitrospiraceae bacterium]